MASRTLPFTANRRRTLCRSRLLVSLAFTVAFLSAAAGAFPQTPKAIYDPLVDYPIWVSAEMAQAGGALNEDLFGHPVIRARMARLFEGTPVRGCYQVGPIIVDRYGGRPAPRSLDQAARAYPVVALGVVKEVTPGFLVGEPGTLIRAEAEEGSRKIDTGSALYAFVPIADFEFLGKKICKRDPRFAGLPKIGDEILLFADSSQVSGVQYLSLEYPENLIWISAGEVRYSGGLSEMPEREGRHLPGDRADLLNMLSSLPPWNPGK